MTPYPCNDSPGMRLSLGKLLRSQAGKRRRTIMSRGDSLLVETSTLAIRRVGYNKS